MALVKELVAKSIHNNCPRAQKPFVPLACGSIAPAELDSEIFGHVKGAFVGAKRAKEGLLSAADQGTVFLDEIEELPPDLQVKLHRVLQERLVLPLGATEPLPCTARVLAATSSDPKLAVEQGLFRRDLYLRLSVVNLELPPLRDRVNDVLGLATKFLDRRTMDTGVPYTFSEGSAKLMTRYDLAWQCAGIGKRSRECVLACHWPRVAHR